MDAFVYENGTLWQYDAGQKIRVNIDIPDKALVHFSNSESLFVSVVRATESVDVTIDAKKFIAAACPADGEVFNFEWIDGQWTLNDEVVELSYYGITATEPEDEGSGFTVACNAVAEVEVTDGYAAIPNQALLSGGVLNVYAYTEDESGARTIVRNTFIVCERALPPDYVYTETPVINYTTLVNLIAEIEAALQKIINVSASASTLPEDEEATASAELSATGLVFTFGIPQGAQGAPGKDAVVDPTLSVEGEAADAKATGEAIAAAVNLADSKYTLPINGIPSSDIADEAISTNELANGAVTDDKMADPYQVLLWENADDNEGMGSGIVKFNQRADFTKYKHIFIEFRVWAASTAKAYVTMVIPAENFGYTGSREAAYNATTVSTVSGVTTVRGRQITGLGRDDIRFANGYQGNTGGSTYMVPSRIWETR